MNRAAMLASLALWPAAMLSAQEGPREITASFHGLQTGLCVEFLVAPEVVRGYLTGAATPAPIESLAETYPALARVARDEEAYRGWVPANYCWYLYREASVGGRVVLKDDGRQPVGIGYLALAARDLPGERDQVVVTLFTNSSRLGGFLAVAQVRIDEMDLTLGLIPEEEDAPLRRRYSARHGRSTVQWDGGPSTPRSPESRTLRLFSHTRAGGSQGILATITPDSSWAASGTLKVSGEGELQRLMSASPIRLVSSFNKGGDSDWQFLR